MRRSADMTTEELQTNLDLSDTMAKEAEHRWAQGRVALIIGVCFGALAATLLVFTNDIVGAWSAVAGFIAFTVLGFSVWDWSNNIMRQACDVITYEDDE